MEIGVAPVAGIVERHGWRALAALVLAALVAGCTGDSQQPISAAPSSSAVFGLPLPSDATRLDHNSPDASDSFAIYELPDGVSSAAAERWFDKQLPAGQPWQDWQPCNADTVTASGFILTRSWHRGQQTLAVLVAAVGRPSRIKVLEQTTPGACGA